MPLEFETCYRAMLTRDSRFDGLFFTGLSGMGRHGYDGCRGAAPDS